MNLHQNALIIKAVKFENYFNEISFIRNKVFVEEQKIPKNLEWDDQDQIAHHFIVSSEQHNIIAYARLLPSGKLGRVAVLKQWRRQGIGSLLISAICKKATKLDINTLTLSSQLSAVDFYLQSGFQIFGDVFLEAGIKHRSMLKTLK
ncbi:MAG: GNAT family N-acetyltransferase [Thiohalomonadales bacterium]